MTWYSPVVVARPNLAWEQATAALRACGALGSHVLLGFGPMAFYVPESALHGHVYVVGPPNSGKSSRVLAPLLAQLVLGHHAVFCVDCKPDPLLLGHLRAAASEAGRVLRFFSLQPGVPSEIALDCFAALEGRSPRQVAEFLVGSLGLHAAAEPYFVQQNAGALALAITQARAKGRLSFRALAHELRGLLSGNNQRFPHAVQALDALEQLADLPELNPGRGNPLPAVGPHELVRDGSLAYFCLPVSTELKLTSATAASIVLKLTTAATKDLALEGHRTRRIYFAIDEFQDVAAASDLKELVAQVWGVGGGVSLILSHQVPEQLADEGLRALLKNAGVVILLAPRQFARELQEWSGEKLEWLAGRSQGMTDGSMSWSMSTGESWQQTIRPALDLNFIQRINALPGFGFVVVEGGFPLALFFAHHVEKRVADERCGTAFSDLGRKPSPGSSATSRALTTMAPSATAALRSDASPPQLEPLLEQLCAKLVARVLHPARRESP